ncbi:MAG: histidine kinase [Pseudolysinimonas sp.]
MKRWDVVAAALAVFTVLAGAAALVAATVDPAHRAEELWEFGILAVLATPATVLGMLVTRRRPDNIVGALLVLLGTSPAIVTAAENWAATSVGPHPLPLSDVIAIAPEWIWILHFAGPILLALFFPTGRLLSPSWRLVVIGYAVVVIWAAVAGAFATGSDLDALNFPPLAGLLSVLVFAVIAVVKRYRRGDEGSRRQLRWFMLSALIAPFTLVLCWVGIALWNSESIAGIALVLLDLGLAVSVGIAMLRHNLYGFDRVLAATVVWALLVTALALLFGFGILGFGAFLGRGSPVVAAAATLIVAVAVRPLHGVLRRFVDARFQPQRERMLRAAREFALAVRDRRVDPEELGAALRNAGVAGVAVVPDAAGWRLTAPELTRADLHDLEAESRLPLELARLRSDLRDALAQTDASRSRLVAAADNERRRIQRDLHDGAQSNLVALGMRLRELQRGALRSSGVADSKAVDAELGEAVELVQRTISDLRALAQGVRPSSLDEGLEPALRGLARSVPLRVDLDLDPVAVPEPRATAAYYVAAEAITNALKHARPGRIGISLGLTTGGTRLAIEDDGAGGASDALGSGLAGVRDRVEAAGGILRVSSPLGAGTLVEAVFP